MIRYVVLAFAAFVIVIAYVALLRGASDQDLPAERGFGGGGANGPSARVYFEPIAINPAAESMQIRVSVAEASPTPSLAADRDFTLLIEHDDAIERIEVRARQPVPVTTIDLDLHEGDISAYPLDSYSAGISVWMVAPSDAQSAPVKVTVWERVLGYRLRASAAAEARPGEVNLAFEIRRGHAVTVFVLVAYAAMALLGLGAATIGALVFLRLRKPEATLMGALAGIVFALPTLRNALPGGAPLGVSADIFVFLWAELAAVCAITLLIVTWARAGPRP